MNKFRILKNTPFQSSFFFTLLTCTILFAGQFKIYAQDKPSDLAKYTPSWIKDGFADAGATHEPWIFQVRRNNPGFNQWQKEEYEFQTSEEFIKSLADAGVTVYHVYCYKGFGFEAEKDHMEKAAKSAAIAHKYGLKVDTYVQWNTLAYETFFNEVPKAKTDIWYQIDENGKPLMLTYGYQQAFRYRPCFNNDDYMNYFKEKIIRFTVEKVKTDFLHFDNFDFNFPPEADFNPATIAAFRKYLNEKYTPQQRIERFGFDNLSNVLPPMWNKDNPVEKMHIVNDPIIQEWIDFRCWTFSTRLAECARFARELNKEVAIETNPHGLLGSDRPWEAGVNHPDMMQYTNAIWSEDPNNPKWENGVVTGKFRHFKLGRTTNNFILTYNFKPNDFAENLAINRNIGWLGIGMPEGIAKKYLDFWYSSKGLYTDTQGAEKVAVLRSYPSMAYNIRETQIAVNMAEQALQQRQIPFDIIFDQQLDKLDKYTVLVLVDQESLTDKTIETIKAFVANGGGLVTTGSCGKFNGWRRLRIQSLPVLMLSESCKETNIVDINKNSFSFNYGKGRVINIPGLIKPEGEISLGFETKWVMPQNASELISGVYWAAGKRLPLVVKAPEWVGVSHDKQKGREIIHLFSYNTTQNTGGITIEYNGLAKNAWSVSPDEKGKSEIAFTEENGITTIFISNLKVYKIIVLERD
jgi:hypothetical protein